VATVSRSSGHHWTVTWAVTGLTGAGPAGAAPGSTADYLALGDSYASGAGPETGACRVSDGAYPKLWAGRGICSLAPWLVGGGLPITGHC